MKRRGLYGVIRGQGVRTTIQDTNAPCPLDHVKRQFQADRPNVLWVSDFTYVSTWQGFVYVAFIIDVYARRIVGWRVSASMRTDRYTERLAEAGLEPSVGPVGDSYEREACPRGTTPLAESVIGLFKAEVIHRQTSWHRREDVEWATLKWVDWFNNRRLLEPIGNVPPAEKEGHTMRRTAARP